MTRLESCVGFRRTDCLGSVSITSFPNLFILTGPKTLPSGNSTLRGIECSIIYIIRLLKRLKRSNPAKYVTIMPSMRVGREFNENIQHELKVLVYSDAVNTWYIDRDTGKNTLIWPGSQTTF